MHFFQKNGGVLYLGSVVRCALVKELRGDCPAPLMNCIHDVLMFKMHRSVKSIVTCFALFCLVQKACASDTPATAASAPLRFGVLNQQSPIQTAERWNPILRYLTRKTGIPLQLKIGATVEQTDAMMGREELDLVFTNHNFQSEFDGKYKVFARWAGKPIHGVLVVHEDSNVKTLADIEGKTVVFPSSDALVAYAVPIVALRNAKISVTERFAGSQDGALAQLKARQADAAAVNTRFLDQYVKRERFPYRIIFKSDPFNELPIVVHPRVPVEKVSAIKQALLHFAHDPLAAEMRDKNCPGFEAAEEGDYDNVRRVYRMIGQ